MRKDGFVQVGQDVALLHAQRLHRRQHPLHEPAACVTAATLRPERHHTAGRSARSAAWFVGSTPSTRTNAHKAGSHSRSPLHNAAAFAQPHTRPRASTSRSQGRGSSLAVRLLARLNVPSRTRTQ